MWLLKNPIFKVGNRNQDKVQILCIEFMQTQLTCVIILKNHKQIKAAFQYSWSHQPVLQGLDENVRFCDSL